MRKLIACVVLVSAVALAGCKKKEAPAPAPAPAPPVVETTAPVIPAVPTVGSVTLGNAIGADKKVASPMETFGVKDKIFASIETSGTGPVKLRALWSFVKGGNTAKVNETTMEFESIGPAWNEFHIENSKDWPVGDYQVEIFLGDSTTAASTRQFKVQ